jgi:hypothetical protein
MNHGKPYGFGCSCGKMFFGRPAYTRVMEHRAATGHGPNNKTTNTLPGKGRNKPT